MSIYKRSSDTKGFIYYIREDGNSQQQNEGDKMGTEQKNIPNHVLDRLLNAIGREVLKEKDSYFRRIGTNFGRCID